MPWLGETASIVSAITWALANIAFARLPRSIAPFALTALKSVIATVLIAATLLISEGVVWPELDPRALAFLAASSFVGITFGDTFYFHALARIGARRAIFLSTLVPPASALAAYFAFGESLSLLQLAGMVLTLSGVVLVLRERVADDAGAPRGSFRAGVLFGAGAIACQVAANIMTKEVAGSLSALAVSNVRLVFGTAGLLVAGLFSRRLSEVFAPMKTRQTAGLVLVATVLGSYFGIWFYMAAIMYTDIGIAVTLTSTSPIFAVVLAHFLLGERATIRALSGAAVAVAGVALLFAG